jgi:hypothetical protein
MSELVKTQPKGQKIDLLKFDSDSFDASAIMPYPESTLSGTIEVLRPWPRQTVESIAFKRSSSAYIQTSTR